MNEPNETFLHTPATLKDTKQVLASPLAKTERIIFLDCIRGVALLGILLMNITAQSQPHHYYDFLNLNQPITGANFAVWVMQRGFFEGTMRGLFSILFGAGTYLLIRRLEVKMTGLQPADIYFRRLLWLLLFGLINAFLFLWPGDILYPYALCGFLLFPFRNLSPRRLVIAALFLTCFGTYRQNNLLFENKALIKKGEAAEQIVAGKKTLNGEQQEDLKKYEHFKSEATSAAITEKAMKEVKEVQGKNYFGMVRYYRDINAKIQSVFLYDTWFDILLMFFIGIACMRSGFIEGKMPISVYSIIAVAGISIGLLLNYIQLKLEYNNRFDYVLITKNAPFFSYEIRRVCQTMGYLCLLIIAYKANLFKKILSIFAPVGQMAFTNYLMQSIITSIIFYGFKWYGQLQRYEIYYVVIAIWIFQILFSNIWLKYFLFGPFEWLWRSLTYNKRQAFIRSASIAPYPATSL